MEPTPTPWWHAPRLPLLVIITMLLLTLAVAGCGRRGSITTGHASTPPTITVTTVPGQRSLQSLQSGLGSDLTTLTNDATAATTTYSEGDQP